AKKPARAENSATAPKKTAQPDLDLSDPAQKTAAAAKKPAAAAKPATVPKPKKGTPPDMDSALTSVKITKKK
ncbi:MAG: hypothetical protein PUK48_00200, partial [Spirochaetales bacterium]|nr:hypothetical protein [Spirochaetales bacterium]